MRTFDGDTPPGGGGAAGEGAGDGSQQRPIRLPDGVAESAADSELATLLDDVPVQQVSGFDTVEYLKAAHRLATHYRAVFLQALVETGLRLPGPDDRINRAEVPGDFAAEEARAALVWSRSRAETAFSRAYEMFVQSPVIGAALLDATLDEPRASAFCQWTRGLADEHSTRIIDELLPIAGKMTVSQLIDKIKRMAIALDPEWAERRYNDAVRERRVELRQNPDGTADLAGRDLPADRAKTGSDRINALAKSCKAAGDGRRIDVIRADLFLGMLDGLYQQMTDQQVIEHVLANPVTGDHADYPDHTDGAEGDDGVGGVGGPTDDGNDPRAGGDTGTDPPGGDNGGGSPSRGGRGGPGRGGGGTDNSGNGSRGARTEPADSTSSNSSPAGSAASSSSPAGSAASSCRATDEANHAGRRPDRTRSSTDNSTGMGDGTGERANVAGEPARGSYASPWNVAELRAELATLLGLDQHPAELPGLGYIPAAGARPLAARMASAQWRFVICASDGVPICSGITTRRPASRRDARRDHTRGGILELHMTTAQLDEFAAAAASGRHRDWADVITDIADRYYRGIVDDGRTTTDSAGTLCEHSDVDTAQAAADARRRRARAGLRRWVEVRDRYCLHPTCRMPASQTDQDHRVDYANGGATIDANLDSHCRHDHIVQHDGGWQLHRPPASDPLTGPIIWTSPLGHQYESRPPPVMQIYPEPGHYYPGNDAMPEWFTTLAEQVKAAQQATRSADGTPVADCGTPSQPRTATSTYPDHPPF